MEDEIVFLNEENFRSRVKGSRHSRQTIASKMGISTKTLARICDRGWCRKGELIEFAALIGVDHETLKRDVVHPSGDGRQRFIGNWDTYYFEIEADKPSLVVDQVKVEINGSGLVAKVSKSGSTDIREEHFRSFKTVKDVLCFESYIANWPQPSGLSVGQLKMQPNQRLMEGHLLFCDDMYGRIVSTPHYWLKSGTKDRTYKTFIDERLADVKASIELFLERRGQARFII